MLAYRHRILAKTHVYRSIASLLKRISMLILNLIKILIKWAHFFLSFLLRIQLKSQQCFSTLSRIISNLASFQLVLMNSFNCSLSRVDPAQEILHHSACDATSSRCSSVSRRQIDNWICRLLHFKLLQIIPLEF